MKKHEEEELNVANVIIDEQVVIVNHQIVEEIKLAEPEVAIRDEAREESPLNKSSSSNAKAQER